MVKPNVDGLQLKSFIKSGHISYISVLDTILLQTFYCYFVYNIIVYFSNILLEVARNNNKFSECFALKFACKSNICQISSFSTLP